MRLGRSNGRARPFVHQSAVFRFDIIRGYPKATSGDGAIDASEDGGVEYIEDLVWVEIWQEIRSYSIFGSQTYDACRGG